MPQVNGHRAEARGGDIGYEAGVSSRHWPSPLALAPAQAEDPALIAAAKREGTIVWYTTQIVDQFARPAAAAFEKLYPGIRVTLSRTNATTAALKILNENRAGQNQADVFDGTITVVPLKKEGYVLKYIPEAVKSWPAQYRDPEGYWVATNLYVLTPAFNTRLIPPGSEPKTYEALLDPKYRGKMVWGVSLAVIRPPSGSSARCWTAWARRRACNICGRCRSSGSPGWMFRPGRSSIR